MRSRAYPQHVYRMSYVGVVTQLSIYNKLRIAVHPSPYTTDVLYMAQLLLLSLRLSLIRHLLGLLAYASA
jgi:hypothetical protein